MRFVFIAMAALMLAPVTAPADPLHDAARQGNVEGVTTLLDQGANVSAPDEAGEPVLLIAALAGKKDVVAVLLERGADINIRNKGGLTALHAAAYGGNLEVVELLVEKGGKVDDHENFYQMTPLHAAAEEGHADIVAFLLAHQANIEARERNGYTPLTQAGWRSHWDAAELLLKAGATCQKADLVGEWLYGECTKRQ